jgi:hypothetical protein
MTRQARTFNPETLAFDSPGEPTRDEATDALSNMWRHMPTLFGREELDRHTYCIAWVDLAPEHAQAYRERIIERTRQVADGTLQGSGNVQALTMAMVGLTKFPHPSRYNQEFRVGAKDYKPFERTRSAAHSLLYALGSVSDDESWFVRGKRETHWNYKHARTENRFAEAFEAVHQGNNPENDDAQERSAFGTPDKTAEVFDAFTVLAARQLSEHVAVADRPPESERPLFATFAQHLGALADQS